ncbi:MAG: hypothetical protein PF572_03110 [Patescibacteria group bacterium]|jgi:hypothetical protein|nr:hypothetical protein [Patescibacteria group bacterium]
MSENAKQNIRLNLDENGMIVLDPGQEIVVKGRGGWLNRLTGTPDGADLLHYNPADNGIKKFYEYSTHENPHGAGIVFQEPDLGIPLDTIGVSEEGKLIGMLVVNDSGDVVERFSITNAMLRLKKVVLVSSEGELSINGEFKGFLSLLFSPDKNRLSGYVGIFTPKKPEVVKVAEMENLIFSSFM